MFEAKSWSRERVNPAVNLEVYCDESRQELFTSRIRRGFVVLGSLWLESENREDLKARILGLRLRHAVRSEFKWQKVSPAKHTFYADLLGLFFDQPMRFRSIVLAAEEMDALRFHAADSELMFYKFYYQLLHHWIHDQNNYRIFVDTKTNRLPDRVRTLERVLRNANLAARIQSVQALPSADLDLMQLTDVLTGAVGYSANNRGSSSAKNHLIATIEARLGHAIGPTLRSE